MNENQENDGFVNVDNRFMQRANVTNQSLYARSLYNPEDISEVPRELPSLICRMSSLQKESIEIS